MKIVPDTTINAVKALVNDGKTPEEISTFYNKSLYWVRKVSRLNNPKKYRNGIQN